VLRHFPAGVHWSCIQVEYATDVVFHRQAEFQPLYEALTHTAIHTVKPDHVATFLGRKLTGAYRDEVGNDFSTRIQGTRIKHAMGWAAIKLSRTIRQIKKVELHQHLDGSIPPRTIWRLMKGHGLSPVPSLREMRRCPVVFLPLAPLEWHGPHLPYGADPLIPARRR
jgi:hypothetical protein